MTARSRLLRPGVVRAVSALGILAALALAGWAGRAWWESRLPGTYDVMDYGQPDYGGGPHVAHAHERISVATLHGPRGGTPDLQKTLTAARSEIRLASGRRVDVLAFDGRVPGPELRVREGGLVAVTLVNRDVRPGVSIHWHGVDVPNAEDGVSGVTQNAVPPGGRYTYRFRARQVGTFWYHSHQSSAKQVSRGLYGAFVVVPARKAAAALDLTVAAHRLRGSDVLGTSDRLQRRAVAPGTRVRLRLVNTDDSPRRFTLAGAPFRVVAIDGGDLRSPTAIAGQLLEVPAGSRFDVTFTMPPTPVTLQLVGTAAGIAFSRDGRIDVAAPNTSRVFDPAAYGAPNAARVPRKFDRSFRVDIGSRIAFRDGGIGKQWTMNDRVHPDVPMLVVRKGDWVKLTLTSDTRALHPMHLHGHHMLVLSRNGQAVQSPWWVDTVNLAKGDRYEVAFHATNPGLWMLHCHNLPHAADGLSLHLVYEGVHTPFRVGGRANNHPE
ncbi:MAG: multicopper oxidase family protein [Thermoleophilia bacterium]|nr:multicopper oxidase family protein [Thermoleophilia bacterium]